MEDEEFPVVTSIEAGDITLKFGVMQDNGACAIKVALEDGSSAIGTLTDYERRRLIGALRGDYTVWFGRGDAFLAALEAFYRDQGLDVYGGDGRESFRRGLAAAIATYNLVNSGNPSSE